MRPETVRLEFGGGARFVLGARVVAGFLATEAVKRQHGAVTRHVRGPPRQRARGTVAHPAEAAEKAVEQHGGLMRDQIERIVHQMPVEQRDGRDPRARDRLAERGEMRLSRARSWASSGGGAHQGAGFAQQAGIIGQGEHPGFGQMRHGEVGRRLAGVIAQAERVAVSRSCRRARPGRTVSTASRRRAGYRLSLSVLDHGVAPLLAQGFSFRRQP